MYTHMYFPCIDTYMCGHVYAYIQEMLSFQKCFGLQVNLKSKAKQRHRLKAEILRFLHLRVDKCSMMNKLILYYS